MLPASFTPTFLRQLELLRIRNRRAFLGARQGSRVSLKRGQGIEFSDYRQYELGDNPRHIDWGVFARSEKLYVKQFQEEQDLSVLIFIDTSASMIAPFASKWQRASEVALALAYLSLMEQNTVALDAPGHLSTAPFTDARMMHRLGADLPRPPTRATDDLLWAMRRAASRIRFPGIAVVISDFLFSKKTLEQVLRPLEAKNFEISAIQILGEEDLEPLQGQESVRARDAESGEELLLDASGLFAERYTELIASHQREIGEFLASRRIRFAAVTSRDSLLEFFTRRLTGIGLLQ